MESVGVRNQDLVTEFASRLSRLHYARTTQKCYLATVRRFLADYPDLSFEKVSPEHIERHLHGRPLSPRSFRTNLENLRSFFTWLCRHKRLLRENPCDRVEVPRWAPRLRPAPTLEEFLSVRARCETLEEAAAVELLYFAGLRASELLSLRSGNVDLLRRRVQVIGKGGYERITVFPPRTQRMLQVYVWRHLALHPGGFLFRNPQRPGPRGSKWLAQIVGRLGREAQLSYPLTPHLLRHGYFRLCKIKGVPLEVAAKLGGHKSIRTTAEVYGALDADDLQAAYDRAVSS